jgi:hypothetical protein
MHRPLDPSEICALDFKHEFRPSAICSVSATIGIDQTIFEIFDESGYSAAPQKSTVMHPCLVAHQQAPKGRRRVVARSPVEAAAF